MLKHKSQLDAYLEANGQRIVLHEQLDVVAGPQQLHDRLLVGGAGHIVAVHLQDAVAHAQLAGARRNAAGYDLRTGTGIAVVTWRIMRHAPVGRNGKQLTCETKMPGSWAPKGTHE